MASPVVQGLHDELGTVAPCGAGRDERRAFFGLAKYLVRADGKIADEEVRALRQIETEAGMSSDEVAPTDGSDARVLAVLRGKKARAATLLELIGLAYADREYHPTENAMIKSVASGLGVTDNELLQMENWVLRQMALATEAERFFEGEN